MQRKFHKDNGGYAIVVVLVSIAFAMILLGILTSISIMNYKMKITDYQAKDNFYDAEKVLDEIMVGVQTVVSDAAGEAYVDALQTYQLNGITEEQRINEFRVAYMNTIKAALVEPGTESAPRFYLGEGETNYSSFTGLYEEGLLSFLDRELVAMYRRGMDEETKDGVNTLILCHENETGQDYISDANGIILKGIMVGYTDEDGFYTEIVTDIAIGFPDIDFQGNSTLPNAMDYVLVADDCLTLEHTNGLTIGGSVFAGEEGIILDGASATNVTNQTEYVITKGNLEIDSVSQIKMDSKNTYTKGIEVIGGTLQGLSNFYVADDLTIKDKNAVVDLDGAYYGYSSGAGLELAQLSPDNQSSIIVNGSKTTLDLTGLKDLVLGGNAFVKPKELVVGDYAANDDILLGNSLAVKTDQIFYLVPAECIGTMDGATVVGKNPMTEEDYLRWVENEEKDTTGLYELVDSEMEISFLGKSIKDYAFGEEGPYYRTLFNRVNNETICYVYLQLNQDGLAAYYRDYAAACEDTMEYYAKRYGNNISVDARLTQMKNRGNIVNIYQAEDGADIQIVANNLTMDSAALEDVHKKQEDYEKRFLGLCAKLTGNYDGLTDLEKTRASVYKNLILESAVAAMEGPRVYFDGINYAVVTNEDIEVKNQRVDLDGKSYENVKLIISSEDIHVQGSFDGMLIAGGEIRIHNTTGSVITSNKEAVTRLLQSPSIENEKDILVRNFWINGKNYVFDQVPNAGAMKEYVDLNEIVIFRNFTKQ